MLWIDALTPKQALFAKALVDGAPKKVRCTITSRDYSELNQFASRIGLEHLPLGRHGGGDLSEKLRASVERERLLTAFASKEEFDACLCFLSPEASRVSFGLAIAHHACSDAPHSNAPSRLAVPLSSNVFTPFPIRPERWTRYGIESGRVQRYHALDPWVWLRKSRLKARKRIEGRVLIRLEEWFASYFKKGFGVSEVVSRLVDGIKKIGDFEITLLPRYDDQRRWAIREFGKRCVVPRTAVDGAEMIARADLLIGGGGTMTQEAGLLGVPNISYFPSAELDVFSNYYFPKKLSIEARTPSGLLRTALKLLRDIDREKENFLYRAARETGTFEDPVRFIFDRILPQN